MMFSKRLLKVLLPAEWRRSIRERLVALSVTHICGPKRIKLSSNEAIVTCVVKNGEFYIEPFIKHYTEMGFRHIFFLDNGSTDQTIAIARKYKNVSVCQSTLSPIEAHQALFKTYLARKSAQGGWCLDADIDEFFDYPSSETLNLREFLDYLNREKCTVMVTQLLDMFSDQPLSKLPRTKVDDLKKVYRYYDISNITKVRYHESEFALEHAHQNDLSNPDAALYFGGIRRTLCGYDCLLTKHSLFVPGAKVKLFPHVHFVDNARVADVSGVMLHFKFTSNALDIASQNNEGFPGLSKLYSGLIDFASNKADYSIKQTTAVKFRSVNELVDNGFLFVSEGYCNYVRALGKGRGEAEHQNSVSVFAEASGKPTAVTANCTSN